VRVIAAPLAALAAKRARGIRVPGGQKWLLPTLTTAGFLAAWEASTRLGLLPDELPPVTTIADWLAERLQTAEFWTSLRQTITNWAGGLLIGGAAGVIVGGATGMVPLLRRLFQIPFDFLRPIPAVVYLPLLLLLYGASSKTAIMLGAVGAFWPMMFQTFYGTSAVDPLARDTGRVFGFSAAQRLMYIILPSVLPFIATGTRIASSLALVVVVSVEIISAVPGLGRDLQTYALNGVYPGVYAMILVTGMLGMLLNGVLQRIERSMLKWHPSYRGKAGE
jgi:ABC-type nitrate/sulfonate/bicarbonate transport system permease component